MKKKTTQLTEQQAHDLVRLQGEIRDLKDELYRTKRWEFDTCPHDCWDCSEVDAEEEGIKQAKIESLELTITRLESEKDSLLKPDMSK